jgi:hypothetical protein
MGGLAGWHCGNTTLQARRERKMMKKLGFVGRITQIEFRNLGK